MNSVTSDNLPRCHNSPSEPVRLSGSGVKLRFPVIVRPPPDPRDALDAQLEKDRMLFRLR